MNCFIHLASLSLAFGILSLGVSAQEWTRFRGPNGAGVSDAKTIPSAWTERDINWKIELPGAGHSSPVLWGNQLFVTSADDKNRQFLVICVDAAEGQKLWQRDFPFSPFHKHQYNSFASGTAAVDAQRVYVCWSVPERYTLLALDHAGKIAWEKDLGPFKSEHGSGASPIVYQDKVVLANAQDGESFWIAVAAASGETVWKLPRRSTRADYATPCVYQPKNGAPALVFASLAHGISAVDPDNGKVLWELGNVFDKRTIASPIVAQGLIVGACGSGEGGNFAVAVRPGDPAHNRKPELAYTIRRSAPYVPTSVCVGEWLFLWSNAGVVSCVQAASGQILWQERVEGNFFSSPVCVDGRLFCVSAEGDVVVAEASDHFKLLARNPLTEMTRSTPAVAGGRMYIHTSRHLISVGGRKGVG